MKKKTYILLSLILTAVLGSLTVWNLSANTASAQKSDVDENLGVIVVAAGEYDARDEFALTQGGANGLWNYGYSTSDADNTLNLFNAATDADSVPIGCGSPFERWRINNPETVPQIARHNPAVTCANIPSNALFIHPGKNNQRAVFRFNAPTSGTFQITGTFQKQALSATSDLKIIKNAALAGETVLYTGVIGAVYQQTFNFTVTIAAGDKIDFSVGDDGNDTWQGDGSSIAVTIGQPVAACLQPPTNLQVNVPAENSPVDVQSVNTNASLVGDAAYTNMGKVGRAFELDGNGDYVRVEDNAAQRPATALTAEGWFKFDSVSGVVSLISKPVRNSAFNSYTLYLDGGQLRGLVGSASQYTRVFSNFTPQTGVWHHLAFTYDYTGGVSTLKLYANGVEVTSAQDGTANLPLSYDANPFPLLIGGEFENNAPGFTLDGQADEVSVYGRALAQNEIFDIVQQGSFGKCSPGSACTQAPSGLVSWYRGEGNALDSVSNNNGTLVNGTTFQPAKVGQGFKFDGVDDQISIPDSPSVKPQTLTVETWVKFDSLSSNTSGGAANGTQYLVFKKNQAGGNFEGFVLYKTSDNKFRFGFGQGNGNPGAAVDSTTVATTGVFYHVVGTYDGSAAKIYVNGQLEASVPYNLPLNYDTRPLFLGTSGENYDGKFNGVLDEASIYNRALTATEVSTVFNAGQNGKCLTAVCAQQPNNLVSLFASEQNALDSKSNNHGTLQNGAAFSAAGKVGNAFSFDGVDDYVQTPINMTPQTTIEAWVNPSTLTGGHTDGTFPGVVRRSIAGSAADFTDLAIGLYGGKLGALYRNTSSTAGLLQSNIVIQTGVWYHIAVTIDGTTARLYVNGNLEASGATSANYTPHFDFRIGGVSCCSADRFGGLVDEVGVYNRALTAAEISSIYNTGSSGKCKPVGLNPAANQVAWFTGDGDTRDFLELNPNGTLNGNANFTVGKVGQSFNFDGSDDNVAVANNANLNPTSQMTLETWVYKRTGGDTDLVGKDGETSERQYWLGAASNGRFRPHLSTTGSGLIFFDGATQYNLNEWYHIAMTYDGAVLRLYVNGVIDGQIAASGSIITTNQPLRIGGGAPTGQLQNYLNGKLDEISLYSRALTASEIAAVYSAGAAGKVKAKTVNVLPPSVTKSKGAKTLNVLLPPATVQLSDATVTFANVTSSGTVSENGIDLGLLPALPSSVTFTGLAYDIRATAAYQQGTADDVQVCFNLPSLAALNFANLRILHLENGAWVNRTAAGNTSPNLCTDNLTSLSPFVIVQALAPTAANISIAGRVADASGRAIGGVSVTLTDSQGRSVSGRTNNFGRYSFGNVGAGDVYIVSVSSKRYSFAVSSQAVNAQESVENLDFTASQDALLANSVKTGDK